MQWMHGHKETPPRAWGRRCRHCSHFCCIGNTPTGVGKTVFLWQTLSSIEKHPHGRGEDSSLFDKKAALVETPPRAWGRLALTRASLSFSRNTPTGVGKTTPDAQARQLRWKHPHGRGEDSCTTSSVHPSRETPPRAWGRPSMRHPARQCSGNTPTGVGKTDIAYRRMLDYWKHPHGRGEDQKDCIERLMGIETPPRAWGRHELRVCHLAIIGNTPTGVGKTAVLHGQKATTRKHPHGRGEDCSLG